VDGTGSGLCPVGGFGISGVERASTVNSRLISQLNEFVPKHEKIPFYFHVHNISSGYKIYKKSNMNTAEHSFLITGTVI
jgi:hypothetical protein